MVMKGGASALALVWSGVTRWQDEEFERLSVFLLDPHPKMPNFNLSRQEITDLLAYIRSLR